MYKLELQLSASNLFYSCLTFEVKKFLKYSGLQETILNVSLILVNQKFRMAGHLKKLYRVRFFEIIIFNEDTLVLTPGTSFHERSL